jgi:16S rRNA (guanine527-N7)-methyltransferase
MQLNGISVSRETVQRLERFEALFQRWAKAINLVAPSTKADFWQRHIADSAQIFQLSPHPHTWVDLGSGGGFPGIITAIFLAELGNGWVHLVESNQKKASFLRTALTETGGRGSVHPVRIEQAPSLIPTCDLISARALAELPLLLDYCSPWMAARPDVKAFLHKGRDYASEVNKANGRWSFDLIQHASAVEDDSVILEISNLQHQV